MHDTRRYSGMVAGLALFIAVIAVLSGAPKNFAGACALIGVVAGGICFYADEKIRAAKRAVLVRHVTRKKSDAQEIRAAELQRRKTEEEELTKAVQPWLSLCAIFQSGHQLFAQRDPTDVGLVEWRRAQLEDALWPFFPALRNAAPKEVAAVPGWYRDLLSTERPLSDLQFDDGKILFEASDGEYWEHEADEPTINALQSTQFVNQYFVKYDNASQAEAELWGVIDELTGVFEDPPEEFPSFPKTTVKELLACCSITEQADEIIDRCIAAQHSHRDQYFGEYYSYNSFSSVPYTNQLAQLAAERKRIIVGEAKKHLIECRDAFWDAVRFRYSQWSTAWDEDDSIRLQLNDDCYIAAASPNEAARLQPPLVPIVGVSEFLWWRHHVLFTRLNKPDYLFLGCCMAEPSKTAGPLYDFRPRAPFYLHKAVLKDHCHLAGRTGGGKTSLFLLPVILQLIQGPIAKGRKPSKPSPIVILDLAGDEVLFQETKRAAEERGQTFRFFTIERDRAGYRFNPFTGFNRNRHGAPELTQVFMEALGLDHGPGYGRGFYSSVTQDLLTDSFTRNPNIRSFEELSIEIQKSTRRATFSGSKEEALELQTTVNHLIPYPQLITSDAEDAAPDVIYFPRLLQENEVAYFWLPAPLSPRSARAIGSLVLFNFRTAAFDRQRDKPKDPRQAYLFMDEFQKLAGESFPNFLQQARHQDIAVVLANQGVNELKLANGFDLRPGLAINTRVKVYFDVPDGQTFRFFNALQCGETPAALPFPSENSFDVTALYTQGNSQTLTKGQAIGAGTSLIDSETESESTGTSSSKSKSRSETTGGSRSVSESWGYSETSVQKGASPRRLKVGPNTYRWEVKPLPDGDSTASTLSRTIGQSETSSWSTTISEGSSEGQSHSTSKGTGKARGVSTSRTDSTSEGTGDTFNQPTYGSLYSGFAIRTTWHITAKQRDAVKQLSWPNARSIPKAKVLPEAKRQAKALEAAKARDNQKLNTLFDTTTRPPKRSDVPALNPQPPTPQAMETAKTRAETPKESDNAKLRSLFDTGRPKRPGTGDGRKRS